MFVRRKRRGWSAVVIAVAVSASSSLPAGAQSSVPTSPDVAVGPQYDSTHVYVAPEDFDRCIASLVATFGGKTSAKGAFTVTPTPSKTFSQIALTPVGIFSVFGFETPIPYPFGIERTGYLVTDMDAAVAAAESRGADLVVAPFDDPIGKDAIVRWPGGVAMQLYWHTVAPHYPDLASIPENRVYVSPGTADEFVRDFIAFAHGLVASDDASAPGAEIGRPGDTYRRIRVVSKFGKTTVLVTDGHLPFPYGHETTGYEVSDLRATLAKATGSGATVLVAPYVADDREAAVVQFPGGYVAEIHTSRAN